MRRINSTEIQLTCDSPETARITTGYSDGSKKIKTVQLTALMDAITSSREDFKGEPTRLELPENSVFFDLYPGTTNHYRIGIFLPAKKRMINFFSNIDTIPFPSLLFVFEVEDGSSISNKVFAMTASSYSPKAKRFHYPFGNVYNDGKICFGNNVLPKIETAADTGKIVAAFMGSETNNDLWGYSSVSKLCIDEVKTQNGLISSLKSKETFPAEYLIESKEKI